MFANGTQIELTKVWSALAAYEHIWNPKWRTAVGGGYVNVDYNGTATNLILARTPGAAATCGVAAASGAGNCVTAFTLQRRQQLQSGLQLLGSLYPHPVEPGAAARYRSARCCITHNNTAFKGPATLAANGSRPAVINGVIDDQNVWSAMFRWQRNFYP